MTLISGIPPWVQMYFEKIVAKTGKQISDVFPNFSLLIFGVLLLNLIEKVLDD